MLILDDSDRLRVDKSGWRVLASSQGTGGGMRVGPDTACPVTQMLASSQNITGSENDFACGYGHFTENVLTFMVWTQPYL